MQEIDLSIVVLSFNTKELLKECLASIKKNAGSALNYELIVVDNASSDESAQMVREEFKDVLLIANKTNVGYTKGNNMVIKQAKGRYVLFLNADTIVYKNTLEVMVDFMDEYRDAAAATCRVELPNGKLDDSCHRGFPTPWRAFCHFFGLSKLIPNSELFNGYHLGWKELDKIHEIDSCSGAFMIVRRTAGEEISWWDEDFFWYGDDLDFCYRLNEKGPSVNSGQGWKVYFVPTVKILHYKGVSGGIKSISRHLSRATRETRLRVTRARFEAMKIFYQKHYIGKYPKIVTWLIMYGVDLKLRLALRSL